MAAFLQSAEPASWLLFLASVSSPVPHEKPHLPHVIKLFSPSSDDEINCRDEEVLKNHWFFVTFPERQISYGLQEWVIKLCLLLFCPDEKQLYVKVPVIQTEEKIPPSCRLCFQQ